MYLYHICPTQTLPISTLTSWPTQLHVLLWPILWILTYAQTLQGMRPALDDAWFPGSHPQETWLFHSQELPNAIGVFARGRANAQLYTPGWVFFWLGFAQAGLAHTIPIAVHSYLPCFVWALCLVTSGGSLH